MARRAYAWRLLQPWLLIAAGVLTLAAITFGWPRYELAIPPPSIAVYSEPGVFVARVPAARWPGWLFELPQDDHDDGRASRLMLFEDGRALGPPHTSVADIGVHRGGRFAHWDGAIYFSATDNSDPRSNGRGYTAESPLLPQWPAWVLSWSLLLIGVAWHLAPARRRAPIVAAGRRFWRPALYAAALGAGALWAWSTIVGIHQVTPLTGISTYEGLAYRGEVAPPHGLHQWLLRRSDMESAPRPSTLLLEDGVQVGFPRATLSTVAQMGAGRYAYQRDRIYFSTTDGSDPRTNGRAYAARARLAVPPWYRAAALVLLFGAGLTAAWQFRAHTRWIAGCIAGLSAAAAACAISTHFNVISVDEFVPRARLSPSTATAFVADHREIIAPFILVASPGTGPAYLIADGEAVLCHSSILDDSASSGGLRCARRESGTQIDFVPAAGIDPRVNTAPYAVRLPIRAHPYLILALIILCGSMVAVALFRPRTRVIVTGVGALVAALGLTLTAANVAGLLLPLRSPDLASLARTFGPDDLTMSYEQALARLEPRAGETRAAYAERATFTLNAAIVHASPATELEKWRMHVPIWENWALHLLGLTDARVRRYIFWDPRKHLERGIGLCGDLSAVLVAFLEENGIEARVVSVTGHVVATAEVESGIWQMYDPDYGLVIPYSLAEVQADPTLVEEVYSRWARERPALHSYTRDYAANIIPSFFASTEDNSVDPTGRTGFYSGLARSTEAYIAREALLYRIKWVVPFVLIFVGLGVALLAWPPRRQPN